MPLNARELARMDEDIAEVLALAGLMDTVKLRDCVGRMTILLTEREGRRASRPDVDLTPPEDVARNTAREATRNDYQRRMEQRNLMRSFRHGMRVETTGTGRRLRAGMRGTVMQRGRTRIHVTLDDQPGRIWTLPPTLLRIIPM